ncbi:MAG: hypothetical protein JXA24_00500, partial [Proteobacteria bacterium]|nr:hypothetical protein [Pseudomonadota bacterium]
ANISVSQFALAPGPTPAHALGVVLGPMTAIRCDAYVVPHSVEIGYSGRTRERMVRAGAASGIEAFDRWARQRQGRLASGDVHVTESGGGRSSHLVNILFDSSQSNGHKAAAQIGYVLFSALLAARTSRLETIALPALGLRLGDLGPERAAGTMIESVTEFWNSDAAGMPRAVLIAVEGELEVYRAFAEALKVEAPRGEAAGSVESALRALKPLELCTLLMTLTANGGRARSALSSHRWFGAVEPLFTEEGGQSVPKGVLEELRRIVDSIEG